MSEEKTWNLDECIRRGDQAHDDRKRITRLENEIEQLREQDRKQWEFSNGGKNPISDDPESLDPEEHLMYERLGKLQESEEEEDNTFTFLALLTAIIVFICLYESFNS